MPAPATPPTAPSPPKAPPTIPGPLPPRPAFKFPLIIDLLLAGGLVAACWMLWLNAHLSGRPWSNWTLWLSIAATVFFVIRFLVSVEVAVALFFLPLMLVLGPMRIRKTSFVGSIVSFAPFDLLPAGSALIPAETAAAYESACGELQSLGFRPVGRWKVDNASPATAYAACFRHDRDNQNARVLLAVLKAPARPSNVSIAFGTEFVDNPHDIEEVVTHRAPHANQWPPARRAELWVPDADVARLYQLHTLMLRRFGGGRSKPPRDYPAAFEHNAQEFTDLLLRRGVLWADRSVPGRFRFTFKGACLNAWLHTWPFKEMVRRRDLRAARRLLIEIGA